MSFSFDITPPPSFYLSCKSSSLMYDRREGGNLILPDGRNNSLLDGVGYLIANNLKYTCDILNGSNFSLLLNVKIVNILSELKGFIKASPLTLDINNKDFILTYGNKSITVNFEPFGMEFGLALVKYFFNETPKIDIYINENLIGILDIESTEQEVISNIEFCNENIEISDLSSWLNVVLNQKNIEGYFQDNSRLHYYSVAWVQQMRDKGLDVPLKDLFAGDFNAIHKEEVSIGESYQDFVNFNLKVLEPINIVEKPMITFTKPLEDLINIETLPSFNFKKNIFRDLLIEEEFKKVIIFNREFLTDIDIYIKYPHSFTQQHFYTIFCEEFIPFRFIKQTYLDIPIDPLFKKVVYFNRKFDRNIGITPRIFKKYTANKYSTIEMYDEFLKNSEGILSDIKVFNRPISLDYYEDDTQSIYGYTPFRTFLGADYDYQEAIIKIHFGADITSDRPYVNNWIFNVDVPDIVDRGIAQLGTAQPVTVYFNKSYHIAPEVTCTVKTATAIGTIPSINVYEVTNKSFKVELKNGATYCAGSVSWNSIGY